MCLRRAHVIGRKKGWFFTSDAPAREPSRLASSLMRSFRMTDLQRLSTISNAQDRNMPRNCTYLLTCVACE